MFCCFASGLAPKNQEGESQGTAPQEGEQNDPAPAGEQNLFQYVLKTADKKAPLSDSYMEV